MPPSTTGQWTGVNRFAVGNQPLDDGLGHSIPPPGDTRGLFVLHAVLLHTGMILCFGGHVENAFYPPLSYVFDPEHPARALTPIPFPAGMDLFCCHYVQLPNGRILVMGGSDKDFRQHGSSGAKNIVFFEPSATTPFGRWVNTGNDMAQGRWYPTPLLLPDGRVMVVSGRPEYPKWEFPKAAARAAALPPNGIAYVTADIGKLAYQNDTGTYWRLLSRAPTWTPANGVISDEVEILSPPHRAARIQTGATKPFPIYPGMHLAPNGKVYFTATTWGQEIPNPDTSSIQIPASPATSTPWTEHAAVRPSQSRREEGMSVLLPLTGAATDGQILVIGGSTALRTGGTAVMQGAPPFGNAVFHHVAAVTDARSADILHAVDPPAWLSPPPAMMSVGHTNGHCVLLPDETVFICGGHNGYKWQARPTTEPSLESEIFAGGAFRRTSAAPAEPNDRMHAPRMYHSVALLLPDGRVWVAGGADPNRGEPTLTYPPGWPLELTYAARVAAPGTPLGYTGLAENDKTWEFYEPPYYFNPNRAAQPEIEIGGVRRGGTTTSRIAYGSTFQIRTPQAATIDRVAIMRPGAPTHHTDTEQRYVRLELVSKTATELTVRMESDRKKAPPGFYMLWIVDSSRRPCKKAPFIHLV
jgi:hypothetical protein